MMSISVFMFGLFSFCLASFGQQRPYEAVLELDSPADLPLERYSTYDRFGRRITFYLDRLVPEAEPIEALAVTILGSGSYSQFQVQDGRTRFAQRDFLEVLHARARMLMVEKVGVEFGKQPKLVGTAEGSSLEFRREHTLERWVEAVSAALRAARSLPGMGVRRTLVAGHSEGALVAAAVAARNGFVTDVACLAGGGPTQLFDFFTEARAGLLKQEGRSPTEQLSAVRKRWREIQSHANDAGQMWLGHAYPYWASFMEASMVEELGRSRARVFVAQGSRDGVNPRYAVDMVEATLPAKGLDVTALLVEGANHGFQFSGPGTSSRDGWREILERVVNWFLEKPHVSFIASRCAVARPIGVVPSIRMPRI